mmetsp:Transcript_26961/g.42287  ORF Transcript_26961/g.42287 Transcript_26961/m.42287 type:complete len:279 (-) Transcript_26961:71-907(-)
MHLVTDSLLHATLSGGTKLCLGVANKVRVTIACIVTGEINIAGNSRPTNSVEAAVRVGGNNDRPTQSFNVSSGKVGVTEIIRCLVPNRERTQRVVSNASTFKHTSHMHDTIGHTLCDHRFPVFHIQLLKIKHLGSGLHPQRIALHVLQVASTCNRIFGQVCCCKAGSKVGQRQDNDNDEEGCGDLLELPERFLCLEVILHERMDLFHVKIIITGCHVFERSFSVIEDSISIDVPFSTCFRYGHLRYFGFRGHRSSWCKCEMMSVEACSAAMLMNFLLW